MSDITPTGPKDPSSTPLTPIPKSPDEIAPGLSNSPWAQMFAKSGTLPTAKELKQLIDGLLRDVIHRIKKDDDRWKEVMRKMKEVIEDQEK